MAELERIDSNKFKSLIDSLEFSMSKFQIEKFVLNEQLTDYKKLKQSLVEYNSRLTIYEQNLIDIEIQELEIANIDLDIEQVEEELNGMTVQDSREYKRFKNNLLILQANRKKNESKLNEFIKNQSNILFELKVFEKNVEQYLNLISADEFLRIAKDEKLKDSYEQDYWEKRFATNAFTDIMSIGAISNGLLQSILNMPMESIGVIFQEAISKKLAVENEMNIRGQLALEAISQRNEFE